MPASTGIGARGCNDDGVIEVEFEVDQNRVGKRWRVTLVRDGRVVFRGHRTTSAPISAVRAAPAPPSPSARRSE